jgi:uncharacterized membrane protein YdbT with pleckstrin-like domain
MLSDCRQGYASITPVQEKASYPARDIRMYLIVSAVIFAVFALMTTVALYEFFDLAFWQPIIAIIISAPLAYLAVRFVGIISHRF